MKRIIICSISILLCLSGTARTTYIPTYKSLLQIVNTQNDTVSKQNNLEMLEMMGRDGTYKVSIVHEDVTKEKVKAIKRAKAAAGWMMFATVMSGVSAALSHDHVSYYNNMENTQNAAAMTDILDVKAKGEQTLGIEVWIDNLSDHELMVVDMERGLTWFALPHKTLVFTLSNPGVEQLRISDVHHQMVEYVTAAAGSSVKKETIEWEDDECWIVSYTDHSYENYNTTYKYISKVTYERREMTKKEVKDFKKEKKAMQEE